MIKVRDSGVQGKAFLGSPSSFEAELTSHLLPCGTVRLLDQSVATGCRHNLGVLHAVQHGKFLDGRPGAPQRVGVHDLWDLVFTEQPTEEGPGSLRVPVRLEQEIEHGAVLVDGPPQPRGHPSDLRAHLVQTPPGTPTGFPVTQRFGEQRSTFDVPLAQGFVTDPETALVAQCLYIPLAEREAVGEPQGLPDDAQGETVAVGLRISHSSPADRA